MPWIVIVLIVIAVFAYGEWKEWRGEKRGDEAGYGRAMPLIEAEVKRERRYWLAVMGTTRALPPQPVVLQLGDGMEIRQKPAPRK